MKGIVITTDRTIYKQDFGEPLYKTVGKVVGGPIEIVNPKGFEPYCMIVNGEGLLTKLPVNYVGCFLYETHTHGHPIVGNIVIMQTDMTLDGPDIVGLSDADAKGFTDLLKEIFSLTEKRKGA